MNVVPQSSEEVKKAIDNFFCAIGCLKELGVIRSGSYLGDLGEYLACKHYHIKLAESLRNEGYDGIIKNGRKEEKVQVKYHNAAIGTNIKLGDPRKYDSVIVVLGPESTLRQSELEETFLLYKFSSEEVEIECSNNSGFSAGKALFKDKKPDHLF